MNIEFSTTKAVSTMQFKAVLEASTLGKRRPVDDLKCLAGMLANSNLLVTAWHEERLVGVARSVTDFHYACYLSDLAVDVDYQSAGVGRRLQAITKSQLGPHCKLILIAAPQADAYYGKLGFTKNPRCWVLNPEAEIKSN